MSATKHPPTPCPLLSLVSIACLSLVTMSLSNAMLFSTQLSLDVCHHLFSTSIRLLQQDFLSSRIALYKAAHVYFTESCPDELFNELCKSPCAK
ncbi:unnamed protein product, partial [Oppiella nova]